MRVFILCCTALLCTSACHAQLEKGTWLVGGTINFSSEKNTTNNIGSSSTSKGIILVVSPAVGYFLADRFSIGLLPTFTWDKGKVINSGDEIKSNLRRFRIGPFVRYYLLDKDREFNFLIHSAYQIGFYNYTTSEKGKLKNFSVATGPVIFFNSSVALEVLLGYSSSTNKVANLSSSYKSFQTSIGLQVHLEK
jgi:hypothetical protein